MAGGLSQPLESELPTAGNNDQDLISAVVDGWERSRDGDIGGALAAYRRADRLLPRGFTMSPELSVLRHNTGAATGAVVPIPPTENRVVAFTMMATARPSAEPFGLHEMRVNRTVLEANIRQFMGQYRPPGHHLRNLGELHFPHTMVLSTGRCGTVSLYHLLSGSRRVLPFHTFWWLLSATTRWEVMCRFFDGRFDNAALFNVWLETRAAEWLTAAIHVRSMVDLNHLDTVFAPAFAALHPISRFVHLHRDPVAVFHSFYAKNQWLNLQLRPLIYAFDPRFRYQETKDNLARCIAWYVHFTNTFAAALGSVLGPGRFLAVSSEKLFAQDREEIRRLLMFVGAEDVEARAVDHFGKRINEKAHKATVGEREMAVPQQAFQEALWSLEATGSM